MPDGLKYSISEDDFLLRTLPKQPAFIGEDNKLTSAVFKKSKKDTDGGVSVDVKFLVLDVNHIYNSESHYLASLCAKVPLDNSCPCNHDPLAHNHAHALIMNVTKGIAKTLSSNAILISNPSLST